MSTSSELPAVLLLAFNRPATTARVFEAIRAARPPRLYVAVDGPRAARPEDAALCEEVRRIASSVDWPCQLHTQFRQENLGCKRGVSAALDWFFSREEAGIVLEDDCLPSRSFFPFCGTLLEQFREDDRVFAIQGTYFGSDAPVASSYAFSKLFHMWGWATWANRWNRVQVDRLDIAAIDRALHDDRWLGPSAWIRDYWRDLARLQDAGAFDSWGYSVLLHCFQHKLFNVTPTVNLVRNIGTGQSATRTRELDCGPQHVGEHDVRFPLAPAPRHAGADEMLAHEHRWRIQLTPWRLFRQAMHFRLPRLYRALRRLVHRETP